MAFDDRITIRGLEIDSLAMKHIQDSMHKLVKLHDDKYGASSLKEMKVQIETVNKEGGSRTFIMNASAFSDNGRYAAKKKGWDIITTTKDLADALRQQIL